MCVEVFNSQLHNGHHNLLNQKTLLLRGTLHTANEGPVRIQYKCMVHIYIRGASKIKLKKVNKKKTVTVRRVIIFLNISRRPLLICLHCCLHQYKTLKAVATAIAAIVLLTPAKNLYKVFWGFYWSPPCLIIIKDMYKYIRG